jgi:nucleotide-binding universal stress UspA family protein
MNELIKEQAMKILLATDGSEYSEAAVDEIANRPFPPNTEVLLLSVLEVPAFPLGFPFGGVDFFDEQMQKNVGGAVEKAAKKLSAGKEGRKLKVLTRVLCGSPKRVILEQAEALGADLIVVGSHGLGAWDRLLLGSVSLAVATHAKCSVEIVRVPAPNGSET